jgi:hypothetical protein
MRAQISGNSSIFQQTYVTGHVTMAALEAVWTLSEAERAVEKLRSSQPRT